MKSSHEAIQQNKNTSNRLSQVVKPVLRSFHFQPNETRTILLLFNPGSGYKAWCACRYIYTCPQIWSLNHVMKC